MNEPTGIIYALLDPRTGLCRYIGQTRRPLQTRHRLHCWEKGRNRKCNWVTHLRKLGMRPIIKELSRHPVSELNAEETSMIACIYAAGGELLNSLDGGGQGVRRLPSINAAIGAKHKGRKLTPEHQRRVREGMKRAELIRSIERYFYFKLRRNPMDAFFAERALFHAGYPLDHPLVQCVKKQIIADGSVQIGTMPKIKVEPEKL